MKNTIIKTTEAPMLEANEKTLRSACDAIVANATDLGDGTKLARIPCNLLMADSYQRTEDFAHVQELVNKWNESKCDPLSISYRDGKFWVMDGQHRLRAANILGLNDLKCIIHKKNFTQEAEFFADQDDGRKRVSVYSKIRAKAMAGKSPYEDILTICNNQRINLVESTRPAAGECGCASTLLRVYHQCGRKGFIWVLETIRIIGWSLSYKGYSADVIGALGNVYHKSMGTDLELVRRRIDTLVSGDSPCITISHAHGAYMGRSGSAALAEYFL